MPWRSESRRIKWRQLRLPARKTMDCDTRRHHKGGCLSSLMSPVMKIPASYQLDDTSRR